jgi:predicted aspartyl protease
MRARAAESGHGGSGSAALAVLWPLLAWPLAPSTVWASPEQPSAATVPAATMPAVATAPGEIAEPQDEAAETVYVTPTMPDRIGRIMAPVFVNGQGPYPFVIDTGASRSVLAPRLAERLGLVPDPSRTLELRGMTGSATVPTLLVERLEAGDLKLANQRLPVIAPSVFADADGILGIDGLKNMCLRASFTASEVSITRKGCPMSVRDWPRASATLRFGGLVLVKARLGGLRVQAIIDTGAERSLGNSALLEALELEPTSDDPRDATTVLGATEHRVPGRIVPVSKLNLGEFEVTDLDVTFGDFDVFRLWGLEQHPAIVLGMDVIGQAEGIAIDYRRAEIRVLPRGSGEFKGLERRAAPGRLPRSQ